MSELNKGLQPLPVDERDFPLGAIYRLPKLDELPDSFELEPLSIKNQGTSDFCSAYASCGMSEIQEGVQLYPEYSFALSKSISGDPKKWGQNLRTALKAHQKFGAIAISDIESFSWMKNVDMLRYLENYPLYFHSKALKHKKKSFFNVTGPYDDFDNIRASIWKFRGEKQTVAIGLMFSWPLGQYNLNTVSDAGFGHMMYVIGFTPEGLVVVNSGGLGAGREGKHIITREVINTYVGRFGKMMMVDIEPEKAKELINRRNWHYASWWSKIIILIRRLIS